MPASLPGIGIILGFALIGLSLILLLFCASGEIELETVINKLFTKGKGKILFIDFKFKIGEGLGHPVTAEDADKVIAELKDTAKDETIKEILAEDFKKFKYIEIAYLQRDTCKNLDPGTIGFYADEFLRIFDPNYKKFRPPKNPLLIFEEKRNLRRMENKDVYDTREILPLMEKNIRGFKIVDKTIGNHDVHVEYEDARFQVFAGSIKDYEVPKKNILKVLNRITEEDVKHKAIAESEQGLRLEVLKDYVFK